MRKTERQKLGRMYLFLRKLENSRILREPPQVMAVSEAPEGMKHGEMLQRL